jgi:hypothetical protein
MFLALGLMVPSQSSAQPVLITDRASLTGNDFIDWGGLFMLPDTPISDPFTKCSVYGMVSATVSNPSGQFEYKVQDIGWDGNFMPGEGLLWTQYTVGPMVIEFEVPVIGAGAQIQRGLYGPFTATLDVYGVSDTLIASFTVNGSSTPDNDNSAIFLGALDDTASIKRIEFSVDSGTSDFAINYLELAAAPVIGPRTFSNKSAKFNFYYYPPTNRKLDYISIVGHLLKGSCEPFDLPFNKDVKVTITVPDPNDRYHHIRLFSQTIPAGTVKFSTSKYRFTSSRSGVNELLLQFSRPGQTYMYLYVSKIDLLPVQRSTMGPKDYLNFIRRITGYNFTIQIGGDTWTGSAPLIRGDYNEYKQQLLLVP